MFSMVGFPMVGFPEAGTDVDTERATVGELGAVVVDEVTIGVEDVTSSFALIAQAPAMLSAPSRATPPITIPRLLEEGDVDGPLTASSAPANVCAKALTGTPPDPPTLTGGAAFPVLLTKPGAAPGAPVLTRETGGTCWDAAMVSSVPGRT